MLSLTLPQLAAVAKKVWLSEAVGCGILLPSGREVNRGVMPVPSPSDCRAHCRVATVSSQVPEGRGRSCRAAVCGQQQHLRPGRGAVEDAASKTCAGIFLSMFVLIC